MKTLDEYMGKLTPERRAWIKGCSAGIMDGVETCRSAVKEIKPSFNPDEEDGYVLMGWEIAMKAVYEALGIEPNG